MAKPENDKTLLKFEYLPNLGFKTIKGTGKMKGIKVASVFLYDPATNDKEGDPYYIIGLRAYTKENRKVLENLVKKAEEKGKDFIKWEAINGLTFSTTIAESLVDSGQKELPEVGDEITVTFVMGVDQNGDPALRAKSPKAMPALDAEADDTWNRFKAKVKASKTEKADKAGKAGKKDKAKKFSIEELEEAD